MDLPSFTIDPTTRFSDLLGDVVDSELEAEVMANAAVTFTPNIGANDLVVWERDFYRILPVKAYINEAGTIEREYESGDTGPVILLANDDGLNVAGIQWTITIKSGKTVLRSWTFNALTDGMTLGLDSVAPVPEQAIIPRLPEMPVGSTEVGHAVYTATNAAAARAAIGAVSFSESPGPVDLRSWDAIKNGQWTRAMGAWSSGGHTITNNIHPFTQRDVGKLVIDDNTGFGATRWFTEIVSVNAFGVATVADALPYNKTNDPFSYGFDITDDLNAALAEIAGSPASGSYPAQILSGSGMAVREAYLPGWYRCSRIVVPLQLTLRGAGWGTYGSVYEAKAGTVLGQLPGSECDFLVFSGDYDGWIGPVGVTNLILQGPEWNVAGKARTAGSGFALRRADGTALTAQDGCEFSWIHSSGFPEHGFDLPGGGVPLTLRSCRAFYNGGYGWNYHPSNIARTQMVHLLDCSGDANLLGGARFKDAGPYGAIAVTAFKSEAVPDAKWSSYLNTVGPSSGQDHAQMSALIFEDCDDSPIVVNGVSHIYAGSTHATGPTMLIKSPTNKVPRLAFNGIGTRLFGSETGDISDSVTLRDEVLGVDIPRSTVNGRYSKHSSDIGHTTETITTAKTLDYFTDCTVLIGTGGAPTLPAAGAMKGSRCRFINTRSTDASIVVDAAPLILPPEASVTVESDGTQWRTY